MSNLFRINQGTKVDMQLANKIGFVLIWEFTDEEDLPIDLSGLIPRLAISADAKGIKKLKVFTTAEIKISEDFTNQIVAEFTKATIAKLNYERMFYDLIIANQAGEEVKTFSGRLQRTNTVTD